MITVAIDLTSIYGRKITGLEIYGLDLYHYLKNLPDVKLIPITRCEPVDKSDKNHLVIKCKSRFLVEQFLLPLHIYNLKADIVLFPVFPASPLSFFFRNKSRIIPTVHDIVPWEYKETLSLKAKLYLMPQYHIMLKLADKIITISETTKAQLIKYTKKEILNFGNQISSSYKDLDSVNTDILQRLQIFSKGYIVSVSTIEPRKNFLYLLEVYSFLKQNNIIEYPLVLVGRKGWGKSKKLERLIKSLEKHLIFTDYVDNEDLVTLYKHSTLFMLFSKYEGFGRTPMEALACNAKVVISDIPIFREIFSDKVYYVPLDNVKSAAEIVERACMDSQKFSGKKDGFFDVFERKFKMEELWKR